MDKFIPITIEIKNEIKNVGAISPVGVHYPFSKTIDKNRFNWISILGISFSSLEVRSQKNSDFFSNASLFLRDKHTFSLHHAFNPIVKMSNIKSKRSVVIQQSQQQKQHSKQRKNAWGKSPSQLLRPKKHPIRLVQLEGLVILLFFFQGFGLLVLFFYILRLVFSFVGRLIINNFFFIILGNSEHFSGNIFYCWACHPTSRVIVCYFESMLKIIRHCDEAVEKNISGTLLGLSRGTTLEITDCYRNPDNIDGMLFWFLFYYIFSFFICRY